MIFFIVSKKRRSSKDWRAIKAGSPDAKLDYATGGWVIIAWNEVFKDLKELRDCVFVVARKDPVCLDIRAQALARFGIDPFLDECDHPGNVDGVTMEKLVATTFGFWAHPSIGNITLSPKLRPSPTEELLNWSSAKLLEQTSKDAIATLWKTLGAIDRSRRDQVRICTSVTELARAIIGEISCTASRRLEKLFALRLCRSDLLLGYQRGLLLGMQKEASGWMLNTLPKVFTWHRAEYTKYYLGEAPTDAWPLFATLLNDATGGQYPKAKGDLSGGAQTSFNTWKTLPTPIRCAVLMNDLRKLGADGAPQNPPKKSMCMVTTTTLPLTGGTDPAYKIGDSASQVLPELKDLQWKLAWSWNRDEYAPATKTYRHFLCPLWAGPSGHTGGSLTFWPWAMARGPLTAKESGAITAGLFTVWRLYYDKRISANHTLAETFEATCVPFASTKGDIALPSKLPNIKPDDDAFSLIELCLGISGFVDPILLLRGIGASYLRGKTFAEQFAALDEDIDKERRALSVQFTVPVWSWALDKKQGLATTSFAQKYPTPSPLATVTGGTQPSDAAVQAIGTLIKKDGGSTKDDED